MRRLLRRHARLSARPPKPRRVAVYVSAHGFGHAVRVAAVLERLHELTSLRITVMAVCNRAIWPASLAPITDAWHAEACDVGVVQSDDVTVDLDSTRRGLDRWLESLAAIREREVRRLDGNFDLVLGDVPSPAFAAADSCGIPSAAVANFSWDWIYSELGFPVPAAAAAADYAAATLLLEATPFGPMPAFPRRMGVGLVARPPSKERAATRTLLGLKEGQAAVLLAFQPASAPAISLPPRRPGRTYLAPIGWPVSAAREDVRVLPGGIRFEDALAAADVVIGKPGYGLIGDVEAAGARFLFVPRPGFPENSVLVQHLAGRAGTAALSARELGRGGWEGELAAVENAEPPATAEAGGAQRAARAIAALISVDSGPEPD